MTMKSYIHYEWLNYAYYTKWMCAGPNFLTCMLHCSYSFLFLHQSSLQSTSSFPLSVRAYFPNNQSLPLDSSQLLRACLPRGPFHPLSEPPLALAVAAAYHTILARSREEMHESCHSSGEESPTNDQNRERAVHHTNVDTGNRQIYKIHYARNGRGDLPCRNHIDGAS